MTDPADGQVHKVIRVVATSPVSWEEAAKAGVREAAKSIVDLRTAKVTELDSVVDRHDVRLYRVKLEMVFQLDRSRRLPGSVETVRVRRYLLVANQTLVSHALHELVDERMAEGPAEIHILAPVRDGDRQEANERLAAFLRAFAHLGRSLTGEVGAGDPVAATRTVMERSSFDEIIVSTLPSDRSRWLKRDLTSRLERAFTIRVTPLLHDEGSDITTCPIG